MQAAVDRLLVPPAPGASADTLQQYLKLLTEAFKRSMALADSLQEVLGAAASAADLANAAFGEALGDYPALELQWLGLLHQSRPAIVSVADMASPVGASGQQSCHAKCHS